MKTIGIIGAMEEEIVSLQEILTDVNKTKKANLEFITGKFNDKNIVLVMAGIGKVNAAMCTQILIDTYSPDKIINIGVAGSVDSSLNIGDIVISTELLEHDFDATAFGYELSQIPRMQTSLFKADQELVSKSEEIGAKNPEFNIFKGRIVSGDQFVGSKEKKEFLQKNFNPMATEMEGAAIAHVCHLNNTPFLIIRSMSDDASGAAPENYNQFVIDSANKTKKFVVKLIEQI